MNGHNPAKYDRLSQSDVFSTDWQEIALERPYYFFVPREGKHAAEYQEGWSVADIFPRSNSGVTTARDGFVLDLDEKELRSRIELFRNKALDDTAVKEKLKLSENYAWRVRDARKAVMELDNWDDHLTEMVYRPFNRRHVYFHPAVVWRPRLDVMTCIQRGSPALITTRQTRDEFGALIVNAIAGHKSVAAYDVNSVFPLYVYSGASKGQPSFGDAEGRQPNISPHFIRALCEKLAGAWVEDVEDGSGDRNASGQMTCFTTSTQSSIPPPTGSATRSS